MIIGKKSGESGGVMLNGMFLGNAFPSTLCLSLCSWGAGALVLLTLHRLSAGYLTKVRTVCVVSLLDAKASRGAHANLVKPALEARVLLPITKEADATEAKEEPSKDKVLVTGRTNVCVEDITWF